MTTEADWEASRNAACTFAYPQVYEWSQANNGGEAPTIEQLQGEPFNFTKAFAEHFLEWCISEGYLKLPW